jgi:hypothetical protein
MLNIRLLNILTKKIVKYFDKNSKITLPLWSV